MRHVLAVGFGLALWLGLTASAPAAFVLSITGPASVNPGQPATFNVSIAYNGVGNNLMATDGGLLLASVGLRRTPASVGSVTAAASPTIPTDFNPAPAFSGAPFPFPPNTVYGAGAMPISPTGTNLLGAFVGAPSGVTGTTIPIGSFTVTGGTPGVVTLAIEKLNPAATGDFVTGNGTSMDDPLLTPPGTGGVAPGTIQFQVVPEPTSMALVGMAATGFVGAIWRKRRKAQTVAAAEETAAV